MDGKHRDRDSGPQGQRSSRSRIVRDFLPGTNVARAASVRHLMFGSWFFFFCLLIFRFVFIRWPSAFYRLSLCSQNRRFSTDAASFTWSPHPSASCRFNFLRFLFSPLFLPLEMFGRRFSYRPSLDARVFCGARRRPRRRQRRRRRRPPRWW